MASIGVLWVGTATGQSLSYAPEQGRAFRYRTENTLSVSQSVLGRRNQFTLSSTSTIRLTLLSPRPRMLWRLGYEELGLRVTGPFPSPRIERLRGTFVTLATTSQGAVLDAFAGGVVTPGLGSQYVERAAEAFFPRLPEGVVGPGMRWTDTLAVTEVLRGVTARIETIVTYTIADTSAIAGRPVVPVSYEGRIVVTGAGTIEGSRVSLSGTGTLDGHYLYDPGDRIFDLHVQEHVLDSTLTISGPQRTIVTIPSSQVLRARAERLF